MIEELIEKTRLIQKYENDNRESSRQKSVFQTQLNDYEVRIKNLLKELEEKSKNHINEINKVHEYYRSDRSFIKDTDQRIKLLEQDIVNA